MIKLSAACEKSESSRYVHWKIFTGGGQQYCSLNELSYSEHYLEDTSQQLDSSIAD
jgi:hypothetical protein